MKHVWPPYWGGVNQQKRINITRTRGSFIFDEKDTKIFDGISSWWSVCHGYNHPKIVKSMQKCLKAMPHIMFGGITHDYAETLAKKLYDFSDKIFEKTFFCDSGSIAVEVAIKMAVYYWNEKQMPAKSYIVTLEGSYHGETFMASNLSSDEKSPLSSYVNNIINLQLPQSDQDFFHIEEFVKKNHQKIACFIAEPLMQGAVGIKFYGADVLQKLFKIFKKYEILFIADECATGFYRTGQKFAFSHAKIIPDITIIGKALTGGHAPLAAVATSNEVFDTICTNGYFRHGTTFMANPLACSAAIASLEIFTNYDYSKHIVKISETFKKFSENCNVGFNHRVFGAIFAVDVDIKCDAKKYIAENIQKYKLWVRPIGKTFYLMPPLNVEIKDLENALNSFKEILVSVSEAGCIKNL